MALELVKNTPKPTDEYPHWDETVAGLLESNDTHTVEYDVHHNLSGDRVVLRKTIIKKARTEKARHTVWVGSVMVLNRGDVPGMIHEMLDLVVVP